MALADGLAMYDQTQQTSKIEISDYAPLVKRIAHHMMMRMPASVQVEDLIQAGMVGLIEAAQKFDASKGASFETYAGIRIRGSIVDEMRRGDWAPRSVHRNARRVQEAISSVEGRTGRDAQDGEVAKEMGVDIDEYHSILLDSTSTRLFSYEEAVGEDDSRFSGEEVSVSYRSPLEGLQREGLKKSLAQAIQSLPEREQLVLALYYDEELNLKEIGQVLGVSESRVSQIHSQAALRLRGRLTDWQRDDSE
ncbi:RNA polymerase sigma factor FliA [Marinibactrum halimedae]|uniref:RNA polymerase sigma factor FliA n=1 Tax=Marinibactrum halimedae TaxID=1444977 RepID=A0AA37WN18_9GAMM|nr:RNA polymerase sigma factor FliA [Marinibactrum halimedae]MCD9459804.1 RNA polymerase sigma factor FliA [Marinibactrum halimedae]GLS27003.1 RNA polymerase sigma factor FliA [Marinibactrum halimedae]